MPQAPSPTDNIARLFPGGGGGQAAEKQPVQAPAVVADGPEVAPKRQRSEGRERTSGPVSASGLPGDWQRIMTAVPEYVVSRNRTQMRKKRLGLVEGKSPGQHYLFGVKLIAVERILGDSLDTSGFLFGREDEAVARTEEAILKAAEDILAKRNKTS